jgi:quercetin dioxygenase-like cupin family protein
MSVPQPVIVNGPNEGKRIGIVGDIYRFLATGKETGGQYALLEAVVLPGGGPPPHIHSREDETFYVQEGEVTFYSGEDRIVGKPGTFIHMPRGNKHRFKNESDQPAKMLFSLIPAGLEGMFLEGGRELAEGELPDPPSQEEIERLLKIADRYGIEYDLPPH